MCGASAAYSRRWRARSPSSKETPRSTNCSASSSLCLSRLPYLLPPSIPFNHSFRILTTPTEDTWKGLELLPEYKATFPKWEIDCLDQKMRDAKLGADGMDLLRVGVVIVLCRRLDSHRYPPFSLQEMLHYDPLDRIQAKYILKHPYFDGLDRAKLPDANYDGELILPSDD